MDIDNGILFKYLLLHGGTVLKKGATNQLVKGGTQQGAFFPTHPMKSSLCIPPTISGSHSNDSLGRVEAVNLIKTTQGHCRNLGSRVRHCTS